jgi:hypothetical protein
MQCIKIEKLPKRCIERFGNFFFDKSPSLFCQAIFGNKKISLPLSLLKFYYKNRNIVLKC